MKRKVIIYSAAPLLVIAAATSWLLLNNSHEANVVYDTGYKTVLPGDTSIQSLGGWQRTSPQEADPVYTYKDTLDGTAILVSQQPIPNSLDVEEMAKNFNATEILRDSNPKVHLGTSAKGPQSAIFTKNGLLILIKSQDKISNESWLRYIDSLN